MLRLTAAVLATAAVANTIAGIAVSAAVDRAVRAEVAVADQGHPFDVRWIRIVDGLSPGESYRLPAFGIRNHRGSRTPYRLVVSGGAAQAERRRLRHWLHFVPAAVVIDAGRSRAVGVRLDLPDDAAPGVYAVVLGVRPGGSQGASHVSDRAGREHRLAATGREPRDVGGPNIGRSGSRPRCRTSAPSEQQAFEIAPLDCCLIRKLPDYTRSTQALPHGSGS